MPIIVSEVVTDKITSTGTLSLTSTSGEIKVGDFKWPSNTDFEEGSVLKTNSSGELVFEPSVVRTAVTESAYTILENDDIVAITIQQATTLTLPDPASKNVGELCYIVKEVPGNDVITILPNGSELISGSTSTSMSFSYGTLKIYTNGTNWFAL